MIYISEELVEKIRRHAVQTYPDECCGAIVGSFGERDKNVTDVLPLQNRRSGREARRRYLATAEDVRAIEQAAGERQQDVLGFYHSHPDHPARPSEFDREHALPWYAYIIVSVGGAGPTEVACWTLSDDRSGFQRERLAHESHPAPGPQGE